MPAVAPPIAVIQAQVPVFPTRAETPTRPIARVVHLNTPPIVHRSPTPSPDPSSSPSLTPVNSPTQSEISVKIEQPLESESLRDVFEGISENPMFASIEPPTHYVPNNAIERLPHLDMSAIPHCSNQNPYNETVDSQLSQRTKSVSIEHESQLSSGLDSDINSLTSKSGEKGIAARTSRVSDLYNSEAILPTTPGKGKGKGKAKVEPRLANS